MLTSLKRAFGKESAIMEWGLGSSGELFDERGALVLSQFTGAARELKDALIVNPYDIGQTADAIRDAIEMRVQEQAARMKRMREVLQDRNVYKWAADLVGSLAQIR